LTSFAKIAELHCPLCCTARIIAVNPGLAQYGINFTLIQDLLQPSLSVIGHPTRAKLDAH